ALQVVRDAAAVLGAELGEHLLHVFRQAVPGLQIDRQGARNLTAETDEGDIRRDLVDRIRRCAREDGQHAVGDAGLKLRVVRGETAVDGDRAGAFEPRRGGPGCENLAAAKV